LLKIKEELSLSEEEMFLRTKIKRREKIRPKAKKGFCQNPFLYLKKIEKFSFSLTLLRLKLFWFLKILFSQINLFFDSFISLLLYLLRRKNCLLAVLSSA
jgi:hypothetical protein